MLVEALASGLPVAAFPVAGPLDVIGDSGAGVLGEDLRAACLAALDIPREQARAHSLRLHLARERAPVPRPYRGQPAPRKASAGVPALVA